MGNPGLYDRMSNERVLISGGGIGGLTLAYWLKRNGWTPIVIERAPDLRTGGYAIDFAGTGFDVVDRMGILPALQRNQVPVDELVYVDSQGRRIAALSMERMRQLVVGGRYLALMHQTLERTLYEVVKDDVEIRFGTSLDFVQQSDSEVHARFNDGTEETFAMAVGADGIHSKLRELVAGPEVQFRRFMGYAIASYPVPNVYGMGREWTMNVEPGRIAAIYASEDPAKAFAFFMWKCASPDRVRRAERLTQLHRMFDGMGWIAAELLAQAEHAPAIFMDIVAQIEMPSWHTGRVAFVGDACACPTLASGQGASLAMGGAYVLAESLRECGDDYASAFARYESRTRPYVEQQQKAARSFMRQFIPDTPMGIALQRLVLRIIFREPFITMLRKQFNVRSLLSVDSMPAGTALH